MFSNVCKPAVYLYTNARGRVIYVSVLFHVTLCMMFVANLKKKKKKKKRGMKIN
jgi:hypothetical protein